ncbi:MAG: hypothetical protein AAF624_03580 [Bacteroidota bacterium]
MNKVALLAVAAAGVFYASTTVSGLRADTDLKADSKLAELEVLAQRTATTGLELASSQVQRDFDNWRDFLDPGTVVQATGGTFKATASGAPAGPVVVAASGTVDTTSFDVYRMLARLAETPAAVSITSDSTIAALSGGSWVISGRDTPSFSQKLREEGYGLAGTRVPAVWTSTDQAEGAVRDALTLLTREQVRGETDRADVTRAGSAAVLQALASEAKRNVTDAYAGDQSFSGQSFGSLGNPVVVQVSGDATFTGETVGYGALLVEGDLVASGDFEWHGLVVAEGVGALDVTLTSEATVYGALYIDHDRGGTTVAPSGGGVPTTNTPLRSGWAVDDLTATLMYYTIEDGQVTRTDEGALVGVEERDGRNRPVDVEAMAFDEDGTLYFVNDGEVHTSGVDSEKTALYRISPDQLDGDPSTPVRVERIGATGQPGRDERVTGLIFHEGSLYGIARDSQEIYRVSMSTGEAVSVGQFSSAPSGRSWVGLTRATDGKVYVLRKQQDRQGADTELWRFTNFPASGTVSKVATLNGVPASDAISAHPDGSLYVLEGSVWKGNRVLRVDPSDGSFTTQPMNHKNTQAFAFYYRGEEIAMGVMSPSATAAPAAASAAAPAVSGPPAGAPSTGDVAPLHRIPSGNGRMNTSGTVAWPGHPSISVSASTTSRGGRHDGQQILGGSTLSALARSADRDNVLLGSTDINNPAYTGPASLSTFNLRPGASSGGVDAQVRFRFDRAFATPFFFHVIDVDKVPVRIEAFDASGNAVSTAGWTMSDPVDLILENGRAETATYVWRAGAGELRSSDTRDNETIAAQFLVDNYAAVREIRVSWSLPGGKDDGNHFSVSTASLYTAMGPGPGASSAAPPPSGGPALPSPGGGAAGSEPPRRTGGEPLRYTQRDNAAVYYSTEALGQLAALLPGVREGAWVVEYDAFGMDVRALFEDSAGDQQAGRPAPRREDASRVLVCIDGRERTVSPVGLELYLAQGATEGACPRPTGSPATGSPTGAPATGGAEPVDPRAMISICHNGQTKQVRAGDLEFWLGRGAREGGCSAPQPTTRPFMDTNGDDDDRDDDDQDDDDRDDDDRDDD